jgi:hypothetical protein
LGVENQTKKTQYKNKPQTKKPLLKEQKPRGKIYDLVCESKLNNKILPGHSLGKNNQFQRQHSHTSSME